METTKELVRTVIENQEKTLTTMTEIKVKQSVLETNQKKLECDYKNLSNTFYEHAKDVSVKLNEQTETVTTILGYLKHDDLTDSKGVIEQVNENKDDISEMKIIDRVRKGQIGVIAFVFGGIGSFFVWLWQEIFVK